MDERDDLAAILGDNDDKSDEGVSALVASTPVMQSSTQANDDDGFIDT
jgi:hypothetical protein